MQTAYNPSSSSSPSAEAQDCMNWWNALPEVQRARWNALSGTGMPSDAWRLHRGLPLVGDWPDVPAELAPLLDQAVSYFRHRVDAAVSGFGGNHVDMRRHIDQQGTPAVGLTLIYWHRGIPVLVGTVIEQKSGIVLGIVDSTEGPALVSTQHFRAAPF